MNEETGNEPGVGRETVPDERHAEVALLAAVQATRLVWPLALMRRLGDSALRVGLVVVSLGALLPLTNLVIVLPDADVPGRMIYESIVVAAINVLVMGYCAGLLAWVWRRQPNDLVPLRELLRREPEEIISAVSRALNGREWIVLLLISTLVWYLVKVQFGALGRYLRGEVATSIVHLWTIQFFALMWALLIYTAILLYRLASQLCELGRNSLRIDLLATHRLSPFMDIGQRTVLFAIGGLSSMLVQGVLLGGVVLADWVPATLLVVLLSGWLLLRPMWGVHLALRTARNAELARLDAVIGYHEARSVEQLVDPAIEHLQRHREQVLSVSVWPITSSAWRRPVLYFVIPTLAWVAAALVESLVDASL